MLNAKKKKLIFIYTELKFLFNIFVSFRKIFRLNSFFLHKQISTPAFKEKVKKIKKKKQDKHLEVKLIFSADFYLFSALK